VFTRQWDDRQNAHDLQASLVTEMASATAHALIGGEDAVTESPDAVENHHASAASGFRRVG
jgi:hypothetical protein